MVVSRHVLTGPPNTHDASKAVFSHYAGLIELYPLIYSTHRCLNCLTSKGPNLINKIESSKVKSKRSRVTCFRGVQPFGIDPQQKLSSAQGVQQSK